MSESKLVKIEVGIKIKVKIKTKTKTEVKLITAIECMERIHRQTSSRRRLINEKISLVQVKFKTEKIGIKIEELIYNATTINESIRRIRRIRICPKIKPGYKKKLI